MNSEVKGLNAEQKKIARNLFKHIDHGQIYLNHAAISPLSLHVKESLEQFIQYRHEKKVDDFETWMAIIDETKELLRDLINADSGSSISFMGNTSDAISAVAEGFPWHMGDEIILNKLEFPANVQPFRYQEKRGVRIRYAEPDSDGLIRLSDIEKLITAKTKMISISAVQYLDGQLADLEAIGKYCLEKEIIFVVDGIQGLGATNIDVAGCNIDAIGSGSHKWLMAPMGIGFLYLSDRLKKILRPYKTGWLSVETPWDLRNFDQPWLPVSGHLETGTGNMLGIVGLNASLKTFSEFGHESIFSEVLSLSNYLINRLSEQNNVSILTTQQPGRRAGIVSFSIQGMNEAGSVVKSLSEHGITISTREGYFRISSHYYNTKEEIDTVMEHLFIS